MRRDFIRWGMSRWMKHLRLRPRALWSDHAQATVLPDPLFLPSQGSFTQSLSKVGGRLHLFRHPEIRSNLQVKLWKNGRSLIWWKGFLGHTRWLTHLPGPPGDECHMLDFSCKPPTSWSIVISCWLVFGAWNLELEILPKNSQELFQQHDRTLLFFDEAVPSTAIQTQETGFARKCFEAHS